jgi:hypothetical protein
VGLWEGGRLSGGFGGCLERKSLLREAGGQDGLANAGSQTLRSTHGSDQVTGCTQDSVGGA